MLPFDPVRDFNWLVLILMVCLLQGFSKSQRWSRHTGSLISSPAFRAFLQCLLSDKRHKLNSNVRDVTGVLLHQNQKRNYNYIIPLIMLWLCFSWHTCYLDQRMQYFDHLCFSSEALLLCLDLYIFSFSWTRFSRHWFIWAVVSQVDANIGENYPQDSLAEVFLWVRGL